MRQLTPLQFAGKIGYDVLVSFSFFGWWTMSDLSKTCDRLGNDAAPRVMQATVAELDGYWLELCCAQHGTTLLPGRLIVQRLGGTPRVADVLRRFTCQICHRLPAYACLNETPIRTPCMGAPPGWTVQLIPAPASASYAEAAE